MKKILIPLILMVFSIGAFAESQVKMVAWGASTSADENKFLEDLGLKPGIGISNLWIEKERFSFGGYYLPNHNADLRLILYIANNWRLKSSFSQYRKWWDKSAGHEKTPGGYAVADWFPYTNTTAPISDKDELYTTRRSGSVQLDFLITPLQKVSLGYRKLIRSGNLTPFFRGFTFVGDVPFAATAASLRNYDTDGQEVTLKGNFAFRSWFLDIETGIQNWDNLYTNSLGTFGSSAQIGWTEISDDFSANVLYAHAQLGRVFRSGEVFGAFAYAKMKDDPSNSLKETGPYISGIRAGSGKVDQKTARWQLGFRWKLASWIRVHTTGTHTDRSKDGSYLESRSDYPAVLNAASSRRVITDRLKSRIQLLFPKVRADLFGQYTYRKTDERFSTEVTESGFDKDLLQDLTLTHNEWREGIRLSLRLKNSARMTMKLEAYQKKEETDLRDLTWGYFPGDTDTDGMDASYRLSLPIGRWQFYVQGSLQAWSRDLAPPFFDPIYDPTQVFENSATKSKVQQHILRAATQLHRTTWNVRFGYVLERFSIQDPFAEFNYQPVEYDLKGILYGVGGVISGQTWSLAWDASFIDTTGSQSHDRIHGYLDFSKKVSDSHTLVATYRFYKFDEKEFGIDDYQGHFLALAWQYKF